MYYLEHQMVQISSFLHSTFKYLSNEYSHAQIRVKMKKLWPRQVGEQKQVAVRKVCRDQKSMSRHESMSRPSSMSRPVSRQAVCRDQCHDQASCRDQCLDQKALLRQEGFVATSNAEKPKKKPKIDILT